MSLEVIISIVISLIAILISVYVVNCSTKLPIEFEKRKTRLDILKRFIDCYSNESEQLYVNNNCVSWIDLKTDIAVYYSDKIYISVCRFIYYMRIYKKWRTLEPERVMIETSIKTLEIIYDLIYKMMLNEINNKCTIDNSIDNEFSNLKHLDDLNKTQFAI